MQYKTCYVLTTVTQVNNTYADKKCDENATQCTFFLCFHASSHMGFIRTSLMQIV